MTETSPFKPIPVFDKQFGALARKLQEWLGTFPVKYDLAIKFPLSQVINPNSIEANKLHRGAQYTEVIPIGIFTPFPNGKLIVAIFETNYEDTLTTKLLRDAGVKVIVKDKLDQLNRGDIRDGLKVDRKLNGFEEELIGFKQHQAYKIFADRLTPLKQYSPFLLLHEVVASSIAEVKPEYIHTNKSSWENVWNHAKKSPFDLLVVDKEKYFPVLAVEFDGRGHGSGSDTLKKDKLKEDFCAYLSLPLIRIDETYLDEHDDVITRQFANASFRQGFVIRVLVDSLMARQKQWRINKLFVDNLKKLRPNETSNVHNVASIIDHVFQESSIDDMVDAQQAESERRAIEEKYSSIYGDEPKIVFDLNGSGMLSASMKIPSVGNNPTIKLATPAIRLRVFGSDDLKFDDSLKSYMTGYLTELAVQRGDYL